MSRFTNFSRSFFVAYMPILGPKMRCKRSIKTNVTLLGAQLFPVTSKFTAHVFISLTTHHHFIPYTFFTFISMVSIDIPTSPFLIRFVIKGKSSQKVPIFAINASVRSWVIVQSHLLFVGVYGVSKPFLLT